MPGIRGLSPYISLLALRGEIVDTLDELKANPITHVFVPVFENLRNEWGVVWNEEMGLRDTLSSLNARIASLHLTLKRLASRTSKALLNATEDDRTHPRYVAHFKGYSLNEFKQLRLDEKLEIMPGWVPELKSSSVPALEEIGADIETAVVAIDTTIKTKGNVIAQIRFFRETGNRKKLFDKVNEDRMQTHADLEKMPHEHMGLPKRFADQFFRRDSADGEKAPTLESIAKRMAELEEEMAEQLELRKAVEDEIAKQAKEKEARAAKQATLADLQQEEVEAEKKLAEIKAKKAELST